jgi:hypothetical protein
VVLGVIDGKPRLRIFASQEQSELEKRQFHFAAILRDPESLL